MPCNGFCVFEPRLCHQTNQVQKRGRLTAFKALLVHFALRGYVQAKPVVILSLGEFESVGCLGIANAVPLFVVESPEGTRHGVETSEKVGKLRIESEQFGKVGQRTDTEKDYFAWSLTDGLTDECNGLIRRAIQPMSQVADGLVVPTAWLTGLIKDREALATYNGD